MNPSKTLIALIEDHEEFRNSMTYLLKSSSTYDCIAYDSGAEFLKHINKHQFCPPIVLMDINLPELDGIESTRQIKKAFPETLIMMCTVHDDSERIFSALKAGASGYILKRAAIEDIFIALDDLLAGGSPMSNSIARKVVESFNEQKGTADDPYHLSPKENEILDLLAEGKRLQTIADELFVSVNTIRTHIRHIYDKLQVKSRVDALNKTRRKFF